MADESLTRESNTYRTTWMAEYMRQRIEAVYKNSDPAMDRYIFCGCTTTNEDTFINITSLPPQIEASVRHALQQSGIEFREEPAPALSTMPGSSVFWIPGAQFSLEKSGETFNRFASDLHAAHSTVAVTPLNHNEQLQLLMPALRPALAVLYESAGIENPDVIYPEFTQQNASIYLGYVPKNARKPLEQACSRAKVPFTPTLGAGKEKSNYVIPATVTPKQVLKLLDVMTQVAQEGGRAAAITAQSQRQPLSFDRWDGDKLIDYFDDRLRLAHQTHHPEQPLRAGRYVNPFPKDGVDYAVFRPQTPHMIERLEQAFTRSGITAEHNTLSNGSLVLLVAIRQFNHANVAGQFETLAKHLLPFAAPHEQGMTAAEQVQLTMIGPVTHALATLYEAAGLERDPSPPIFYSRESMFDFGILPTQVTGAFQRSLRTAQIEQPKRSESGRVQLHMRDLNSDRLRVFAEKLHAEAKTMQSAGRGVRAAS